jgi:hypothetical protein
MDEPFYIPCRYKGVDRQFMATFQAFGYTFRFHVDVDGTDVIFERDEEGNFRAIIPPEPIGSTLEPSAPGSTSPRYTSPRSAVPGSATPGPEPRKTPPDRDLLQEISAAIEGILAP